MEIRVAASSDIDSIKKIKAMVRRLWLFMKIMQSRTIASHYGWIQMRSIQEREICTKSWVMKKLALLNVFLMESQMCS